MKYQGLIWAGISVENLESSVSFYEDVLELPLLGKGDDWAHFDAGNGTLVELFSGGKSSHEQKRQEQQSIVIGLRVENLNRSMEELKEKGVNISDDVGEYDNTRWAHFSDPEGNGLEIKEVRE